MMLGIFLDRDGTLIEDRNYLKNPDEVAVLPGVREAIKIFQQLKSRIFLFSNQSGIARGVLKMSDVELCNAVMLKQIGCGNFFDDICIAPEGPNDQVSYRKPSPKFINEMLMKYSLKKEECFMVGDKLSDIMAGLNAGINSVLIRNNNQDGAEIDDLIK
nr:HAD-IIIA family hydrolase [Opitutales bacterium]